MNTIFKFPLAIVDEQYVVMPHGAEVLAVQVQDGQPCLWAQVDDQKPAVTRRFFIHGTGHEVDEMAGEHIGTFQLSGGAFIGHVFADRSES